MGTLCFQKYHYSSLACYQFSIKVAVLVYKCLHGLTAPYLSDDYQLDTETGRRHLRSGDVYTCAVPRTQTRLEFSYGTVCRRLLKTFCFAETWRIDFLPARRYASAGNCERNVCVRPSVRLSVTRRYCVKTKKASGMISSPSGSPKTLVFWRQISLPNSKGFPPNGGLKQGSVGKIQRFSSFKRQYLENGSRCGQSHY